MGVLIDAAGSVGAQNYSERALVLLEESLAHLRAVEDIFGIAALLSSLGSMAGKQGDDQRARVLLAESLGLFHEVGGKLGVYPTLMEFARIVAAQGQQRAELERATRLYGAAEALEVSMADRQRFLKRYLDLAYGAAEALEGNMANFAVLEPDSTTHQRTIAMLLTQLGEAAFAAAWAEGRAMTAEQALAYALADDTKSS
ncbi:MAG TPA: hypothetical protein VGJ87_07750 [Roseiflexaceae bacterium]|jgi:non-specific serine/threonine protein kinase